MLAAHLSRTIGASSSTRATVAAVRWSSQSSSKAANSPASPTVTGPSHTPQPGHVIESQTPDAATPAEFQQSPNYPSVWSTGQNPKPNAMSGPRFEQTHIGLQPNPLSAMEMVHRDPIRLVDGRRATCDGGGGPLGHPKIFINLDKPGPKACGYCGIRFEQGQHKH